ncbi:MAG: glutathione S-transferase [Zoogloeaceae bacterium]|jgi:glutathione S-transferase|nr:glutathione S-transferase [Zoogloeaceae bacterium]
MNSVTLTLYGTPTSGHTHRVELLLEMLELPYVYKTTPADIRRTDAFLHLNPLGQIPVLTDGDLALCDSNAILLYLARRYAPESDWWPEAPLELAQAQRWFSIAAGELKNGPATARLIQRFNAPGDLAAARAIARELFAFMNQHLADRRFLARETPTLADLACYSYSAHAPEGGVSLAAYPHVRAWLDRVEQLPRFKPMPGLPER